jgi:hypothetical protein
MPQVRGSTASPRSKIPLGRREDRSRPIPRPKRGRPWRAGTVADGVLPTRRIRTTTTAAKRRRADLLNALPESDNLLMPFWRFRRGRRCSLTLASDAKHTSPRYGAYLRPAEIGLGVASCAARHERAFPVYDADTAGRGLLAEVGVVSPTALRRSLLRGNSGSDCDRV